MALPPALTDVVFTSTLGQLRRNRGNIDTRAVALEFYRGQRTPDQFKYSEFLAVVNRADAAYDAGRTLQAMQTGILTNASHGEDPTIRPGDPEYAYRVIVRVNFGRGESVETLVIVTSNQPLSSDQIRSRAMQQVRDERIPSPRGRKARAEIDRGVPQAFIITAGAR